MVSQWWCYGGGEVEAEILIPKHPRGLDVFKVDASA